MTQTLGNAPPCNSFNANTGGGVTFQIPETRSPSALQTFAQINFLNSTFIHSNPDAPQKSRGFLKGLCQVCPSLLVITGYKK